MTDQPATSLTGLARSWLNAPEVTNVSGGTSYGYNQAHRAYVFLFENSPMSFLLTASERNPIHNLCFEIKNWGNSPSAGLKINDALLNDGTDFRQGKIIDTDGTYTMIIWVDLTATSLQRFEIIKN